MTTSNVPAEGAERPRRKIIFGDFAAMKYENVVRSLERADLICETFTELPSLQQRLSEESFDIAIVNLMMGKNGPFEFLESIRTLSRNRNIKVIVVTKQVQKVNVQNALKAGAHDFVGDPFETLNLYHRILYHLGPVKVIEAKGFENSIPTLDSNEYVKLLLESTEMLGRTNREGLQEVFYKILRRLSDQVQSNRSSLIVVDEESNSGVVLASSDDPKFFNFPISLDKYPEILHVMHTGHMIFVEDVSQNALTNDIKKKVKSIAISSMMVLPVNYQGDLVGVLVIRRPDVTILPPPEVVRVLQATANTMAAHANVAAMLRKIYQGFPKKGEAA